MSASSPMQTIFAAWLQDNGDTCVCPLCDNSNCVLSNCHCYTFPSFVPTLSIQHGNTAQLCCSNFGTERNKTNIHLLAEERVCDSEDFSTTPFISKSLVSATRFLVRGNSSNMKLVVTILLCMHGLFTLL